MNTQQIMNVGKICVLMSMSIATTPSMAEDLPTFALSCSFGNGPRVFGVASNQKNIFFGSLTYPNQVSKSSSVQMLPRSIQASMISPDSRISNLIIDRETLNLKTDDVSGIFNCEKSQSTSLLSEIQTNFDKEKDRQDKIRRDRDSKPNKI